MSESGATSRAPGDNPGAAGSGSRVGGVALLVDPASVEAPFRQLKTQILDAVKSGQLTPGTRLPAVRTLADEVGISTATAAKVYRELEESGVLEGRGRSGTFVSAADLPGAVLARAAEDFAERAASAGFTADDAVAALRNAFTNLS